MAGVEMLMIGLSCVEGQLSLMLLKSTWLVTLSSDAYIFRDLFEIGFH